MSRKLVTLVYSRVIGSMIRKSILAYMADRANDDGSAIWASKQRIADEIEASRQAVISNIKDMVSEGLLREVGKRQHSNGWTMEYEINVEMLESLGDKETRLSNRLTKITNRYGRNCIYCGDTDVSTLTVDHVVPVSRGGTDHPDNLVPCCGPCNVAKGNKTLEEWGLEPSLIQRVKKLTGQNSGAEALPGLHQDVIQDDTNRPLTVLEPSLVSDQQNSMKASGLASRLWSIAPDTSRKRSSRKLLLKACETAMKAEAPERIEAAWKAYLGSPDARKDAGKFVPAVDRWIRDRKFEAWLAADPNAPTQFQLIGDEGEEVDFRLDIYFGQFAKDGTWLGHRNGWPWKPDEPEADYPDELYARHGLARPAKSGRAA